MNVFDQYIKHDMKIKHYVRYTDDFVIISHDKVYLERLIQPINTFLNTELHVNLHPKKVEIRKYSHGIDFLGYVILPYCRLIRKRTLKRIIRKYKAKVNDFKNGKVSDKSLNQSLQSYLGVLSHADTYEIRQYLMNLKLFQ